ncbi:rhodanese family protein [Phreatobacter oligotrophus]|jgi:rhodanese-related sulfurtransferase|uniref:Rhodanese-related sulfurtransferase n=1 Tax=Phreatobacter oligotrophus TaxID=1122261 RepID=A0A2T4Z5X6_9HYPH|nr:rhodanese family protein [Phreatobacter oligotrophus]PTM57294.1 rhodanese-related sulfurtransferase [Phreatobacter oligotrophus]
MTIKHIAPAEAFAMLSHGAILVDIREMDEWRREHVPLASHHALSAIERDPPKASGAVIFHCRSGNRTSVNAQRLAATVPGAKVYVLDGGIEAWRDAGLPIVRDVKQPIEIMRQVQIVAGTLVAVGTALGVLIHPGFLAVPGFVGAGLAFAGVTGTCAMARILSLAPWNRPALTSASA